MATKESGTLMRMAGCHFHAYAAAFLALLTLAWQLFGNFSFPLFAFLRAKNLVKWPFFRKLQANTSDYEA